MVRRVSGQSTTVFRDGLREEGWEKAYPRQVRQMLMRRSAPQPAMRKTPRGGTGEEDGVSVWWMLRTQRRESHGRQGEGLTEDGDNDDEDS